MEPASTRGYYREKFPHWSKASEFGWDPPESSCNAREAALIRNGEAVEVGRECKVESGRWLDPYTNQTYTEPSDIDTDHVVPARQRLALGGVFLGQRNTGTLR